MIDWMRNLATSDKPRLPRHCGPIAERHSQRSTRRVDRLAAPRKLARRLDIDFTTRCEGLCGSAKARPDRISCRARNLCACVARRRHSPMARHPEIVDLSMNLPPEPDDPELLDRMQDGLEAVGRDLVSLLRYQGFGGVQADKDAASNWLSRRAWCRLKSGFSSPPAPIRQSSVSSACSPRRVTPCCRNSSPIRAPARSQLSSA